MGKGLSQALFRERNFSTSTHLPILEILTGAALMNPVAPAPSKVTSLFVRVTFFGPLLPVGDTGDVDNSIDAGSINSGVAESVCRNCGAMTSKATGREAPKAARFEDLESVVVREDFTVEEEEALERGCSGAVGASARGASATTSLGIGELMIVSTDREDVSETVDGDVEAD